MLNRMIASLVLAGGLGAVAGVGADNPPGPCGKGCCGKCQAATAPAQKPAAPDASKPPPGKGGKDTSHAADRDVFHFLLENHKAIQRTVKKLDNGVETVTESDKPEVAKKIQEHVPAMYERLKKNRPLRMWDPLFVELFKHAEKVTMKVEKTEKGVKVTETSDDATAVKLIQAHAEAVTKFVEKGFEEAHKEHAVPGTEKKK